MHIITLDFFDTLPCVHFPVVSFFTPSDTSWNIPLEYSPHTFPLEIFVGYFTLCTFSRGYFHPGSFFSPEYSPRESTTDISTVHSRRYSRKHFPKHSPQNSPIGHFRWHILKLKCTQFDFGCGAAPYPIGELTALHRLPSWVQGPTEK